MKTQHTPGPWEATGSSANYTPPGDRSDRRDMMDWSSGIDGPAPFTENEHGDFRREESQQVARGFGRTVEEARANARLIAAAPELLAAAIQARVELWTERVSLADAHTGPDGIDEDGADGVAELDAIVAKLDAAIAKATGAAS